MALRIQQAVAEGLSLAASRNGAVLVAAVFIVDLIGALVITGATTGALPVGAGLWIPSDATLPATVRLGAMSLAVVFNLLLALPVFVIGIRLFVAGVTDQIPAAFLTYRIGRATLSGVVAILLWSLLLVGLPVVFTIGAVWSQSALATPLDTIGLLMFSLLAVCSTIVIAVVFFFVLHEISIRHRRVLGAFRGSYQTARGAFLRVGGLVLLFTGMYITLGWGAALVGDQPWQGLSIAVVGLTWLLAALAAVFGTAVISCAYRQLRPDVDPRSILRRDAHHQEPVFSHSENSR